MRAKLIALLILSCAVPATRVMAQDEGAAEDFVTPPAIGGDGHGWVAPTGQDQQLLRTHGSRLLRVFLNLRGLGRLVFNYRDKAPGAVAPPNGKLVRAPGLGIQSHSYIEPRAETSRDDEIVNFPRAIDNSELPCFPPIFYQGELNSCTSVAVTYYQLTHMTGLARGWDQKRPGATRFSPLWTFNLINGGNNLGAFQSKAYTALLAHGAVTLKDMPYRSSLNPATNYRRWPEDPELWQQALEYRIERFGVIQDANIVSLLRRIKLLLVNGHVLTTATAIDGWNKETIVDNPYSRLDNPYVGEYIATAVAKVPGNHCVTIVGYNDDIWVDLNGNGQVDPGEKGALKIANSWGTSDWNRGFRWLHYSALYAPRGEEESAERAPALYANQVFWMTASRDYSPELVMQVDLPPMYRNEYSLSAGVGAYRSDATDATAPNFAFNFNGGRYGVDGRGSPQSIRAVLDVTRPAQRFLSQDPEFFVKFVKPARAGPMLPRAYLTETITGAVHELVLSSTGQAGIYSARAPKLSAPDERELRLSVPLQLDVPETGSVTVPIEIDGAPTTSGNVDVKVFSCNAAVLATNDLAIERDVAGHTHLRINRPVRNGGSCLLSLHASDGKRSANSSIRINLVGAHETSPILTNGTVRRDGLNITIPFHIQTTAAAASDVLFFFDTSNVDMINSYDVTGSGADRILKINLRYWQPFQIDASVYDGHYVGTSRVKVGG